MGTLLYSIPDKVVTTAEPDHDVPELIASSRVLRGVFLLLHALNDARSQTSARKCRRPVKCKEFIIQDHQILRRGVDILDRMVQIMVEGERIEIFDIRILLGFLRIYGYEYHQNMEEKVLRAAPHDSTLHQLILERAEERELAAAIEDALNPKHGMGFVRNSRQLIQLLRNHLDQEDSVLDIAERLLSKEQDELIAAEFQTNPTLSETYMNFARLERKYSLKSRSSRFEVDRRAHA